MPPVLPSETIAHLGTAGDCCAAGFRSGPCPLWVKSRRTALLGLCPLYPQKRTCLSGRDKFEREIIRDRVNSGFARVGIQKDRPQTWFSVSVVQRVITACRRSVFGRRLCSVNSQSWPY